MRSFAVVLIILLCSSFAVSAQQTAAPDNASEPPAAEDASPAERVEWVRANPDSPAAAGVIGSLIADAQTVDDLIPVRDLALHTVQNSALRYSVCISLAPVFRIARQLASAEALYEAAYISSGRTDLESLFAAAQLRFERGDLDAADERARQIVMAESAGYSLKRRAYTLSARVAYEQGQQETAIDMLNTLAELADDESTARYVEVETLLLMQQIVAVTGDAGAVENAGLLLERLFPSSIASLVAEGDNRRVSAAGLPSGLLLAMPPDDEYELTAPATGAEESRRDQPRLSAVQVGSFRDEDNARHLADDLVELGLQARVDTISREGTTLHQVVVTIPGANPESAANVLATLTANGFDGFLVY